MTLTPVEQLPKVELHSHLIGTITPELLRVLRQQEDEILVDPDVLAGVYPIRSWQDFQTWLEVSRPYQNASLHHYAAILRTHCDSLAAQHVKYAELMISPATLPRDDDMMLEALKTFKMLAQREQQGMEIAFLMVIPRSLPALTAQYDVPRFIKMHSAGLIVGAAVVGVEDGTSLSNIEPFLKLLYEAGLGIEIHAGERGDTQAVWDAVNLGYPIRLGHGLAAFYDRRLLDLIIERQIHVELAVSANIATGSVAVVAQHPVSLAQRLGINYSINTDNPGVFRCSMNSEYRLMVDQFNFMDKDFELVYSNAMSSRFV